MTLANILRTDMHAHRPLPADTELARSIAVLARAHQDAIWRRTRASNELRSLLREYFPGFLANLRAPRRWPDPSRGPRGIDSLAVKLREALLLQQLRQEPLVERAMGSQVLRLLATLDAECDSVDEPVHRCPRTQGVCGLGTSHARSRAQHRDHPPQG